MGSFFLVINQQLLHQYTILVKNYLAKFVMYIMCLYSVAVRLICQAEIFGHSQSQY